MQHGGHNPHCTSIKSTSENVFIGKSKKFMVPREEWFLKRENRSKENVSPSLAATTRINILAPDSPVSHMNWCSEAKSCHAPFCRSGSQTSSGSHNATSSSGSRSIYHLPPEPFPQSKPCGLPERLFSKESHTEMLTLSSSDDGIIGDVYFLFYLYNK